MPPLQGSNTTSDRDPGWRAARFPWAILFHAFSVKNATRSPLQRLPIPLRETRSGFISASAENPSAHLPAKYKAPMVRNGRALGGATGCVVVDL
jgi:hypothetical protein